MIIMVLVPCGLKKKSMDVTNNSVFIFVYFSFFTDWWFQLWFWNSFLAPECKISGKVHIHCVLPSPYQPLTGQPGRGALGCRGNSKTTAGSRLQCRGRVSYDVLQRDSSCTQNLQYCPQCYSALDLSGKTNWISSDKTAAWIMCLFQLPAFQMEIFYMRDKLLWWRDIFRVDHHFLWFVENANNIHTVDLLSVYSETFYQF